MFLRNKKRPGGSGDTEIIERAGTRSWTLGVDGKETELPLTTKILRANGFRRLYR